MTDSPIILTVKKTNMDDITWMIKECKQYKLRTTSVLDGIAATMRKGKTPTDEQLTALLNIYNYCLEHGEKLD
jgi:hypothetical protein